MTGTRTIIVGISGASGACYAQRLLQCLVAAEADVHVILSPHGRRLLAEELGIENPTAAALVGCASERITMHPHRNVGSRLASGSFRTDGMVICPCSANTLAAVAAGLADNLITRAAHVTLKEQRRLIVVPRETPAGIIDLRNMLHLAEAGAIICPASPGFYLRPTTIDELVDFVVGKLLDLLEIEHRLKIRWNPATGREPV